MTSPKRSCLDCPSYVPANDTVRRFGRSVGTAMCARYATPIGSMKMDSATQLRSAEMIAEHCDQFGEFKPTSPISFNGLTVATPDPDRLVLTDPNLNSTQQVTTCAACANLVSENRVEIEFGWTASFCKSKGRLILANRAVTEAYGCEYRTVGMRASSTDGAMLFPQYDSGGFSTLVPDPLAATTPVSTPEVSSEREVTDDNRKNGIVGWRKIVNPDDASMWTFLPVFDPEFFSEEERAEIPKSGDRERPELYEDHSGLIYAAAVLWSELDETPALWGPAGTGKTEFARHVAWLMGLPFYRIPISGSTELDDIQGKMHYKVNEGTVFKPGRLSSAWIKPCILLIDEPNTARPDLWQFLRPCLDNSKTLTLDVNEGDKLVRDDNCYPILAMNPSWDPRNRGAEEIADADVSRLMHILVDLPPADRERSIIARRVQVEDGWTPSSSQLDMIMGIAREIRALSEDRAISISWGLRPQIQVARAIRWFPPVIAYRRVIADYLEPDEAEALLACVRANVPSSPVSPADPW